MYLLLTLLLRRYCFNKHCFVPFSLEKEETRKRRNRTFFPRIPCPLLYSCVRILLEKQDEVCVCASAQGLMPPSLLKRLAGVSVKGFSCVSLSGNTADDNCYLQDHVYAMQAMSAMLHVFMTPDDNSPFCTLPCRTVDRIMIHSSIVPAMAHNANRQR